MTDFLRITVRQAKLVITCQHEVFIRFYQTTDKLRHRFKYLLWTAAKDAQTFSCSATRVLAFAFACWKIYFLVEWISFREFVGLVPFTSIVIILAVPHTWACWKSHIKNCLVILLSQSLPSNSWFYIRNELFLGITISALHASSFITSLDLR